MEEQALEKLAEEIWSEALNPPNNLIGPHKTPSEILPSLYLGALYDAKDVENLKSLGITYVLNMAHILNTIDAKYFEPHGITYKGINAIDVDFYQISKHFNETYDFILQAMQSNKKILVNCAAGVGIISSEVLHPLDFKIFNNCCSFPTPVFIRTSTSGKCDNNTRSHSICAEQETSYLSKCWICEATFDI